VGDDAKGLIDPRSTERFILLEVADVDVPPPRGALGHPSLYFRILSGSPTALRVELWQLGQAHGARSVSVAGSNQLKARRIALAAAELVRQLRRKRIAELAAPPPSIAGSRPASVAESGFPVYARFVWSAGGRAAFVGPGDAWLAGPSLGAALRFSSGPRVALGASWLGGEAHGSDGLRWLEAHLALANAFRVAPGVELETALDGALASVRRSSESSVPPLDTWSARAGVSLRMDFRLSGVLALGAGPELGVLLRGIPGETTDEDASGPWLGLNVSLRVDPERPSK
jgi:hypothetical protein